MWSGGGLQARRDHIYIDLKKLHGHYMKKFYARDNICRIARRRGNRVLECGCLDNETKLRSVCKNPNFMYLMPRNTFDILLGNNAQCGTLVHLPGKFCQSRRSS